VSQLLSPLADLGILGEDAIHRSLRAEVPFLVEEACVDFRGRQIDEARFVQDVEHGLALSDGQRSSRRRPRWWRLGFEVPIVRRPRQGQRPTEAAHAEPWPMERDGFHHDSSLGNGRPSSAATFF
jgi:hypothetical protein